MSSAGTESHYPSHCGDGGPATAAQLNGPRFLALDGQQRLYIADPGNTRLRRLGPALPGFSMTELAIPSEYEYE